MSSIVLFPWDNTKEMLGRIPSDRIVMDLQKAPSFSMLGGVARTRPCLSYARFEKCRFLSWKIVGKLVAERFLFYPFSKKTRLNRFRLQLNVVKLYENLRTLPSLGIPLCNRSSALCRHLSSSLTFPCLLLLHSKPVSFTVQIVKKTKIDLI